MSWQKPEFLDLRTGKRCKFMKLATPFILATIFGVFYLPSLVKLGLYYTLPECRAIIYGKGRTVEIQELDCPGSMRVWDAKIASGRFLFGDDWIIDLQIELKYDFEEILDENTRGWGTATSKLNIFPWNAEKYFKLVEDSR